MNYKYKSRRHRRKESLPFVLMGLLAAAIIFTFGAFLIMQAFKSPEDAPDTPETVDPRPEITETRGVFVPTVYNLSFPSRADLTESELKAELDEIVRVTRSAGLNSIFFQVRPSCDALYRSETFPVSSVLATDGELPLDCLAYLTEKCHAEGMAIHAWVNPLRVSTGNMTVDELSDESPAKNLANGVVSYGGKLYLDPGDPAARELICKGVKELCENYVLDGIVFDDYFYPYTAYEADENGVKTALVFADEATYAAFGADYEEIGDFRRDNINKLIKSAYETVKATDEKCKFGVSPFGIWKNSDGENGGSYTKGYESYSEIFCDTLAWIEGGYVDYVAPQIYWACDSLSASYKVLSKWWDAAVLDTDVELMIAHAAYKYDGTFDASKKEMTNQLTLTEELSNYSGSIFYSYNALRDNLDGITKEISNYYITKDTKPEE